ncbi:MAG: hypothetical protein ABIR16_02925 [Dokdonella sp.]
MATVVVTCGSVTAVAEPWHPTRDDDVIESLPVGAPSGLANGRHSGTLDDAIVAARASLLLGQRYSDPRQYGYADAMLAPWIGKFPDDLRLIVLAARIQQFRHDFDGARERLQALLNRDGNQAEATLLLATIEQVQGHYPEARSACAHLAGQGDLLVAITCGAGVASLTGSAQSSADLLQRQLEAAPNAADATRLWGWTVLGEIGVRLGADDSAASAFAAALKIDPEDVYARSAYADLELSRDRPQVALDLIGDRINADALLLRAAIAARRAGAANAEELHAAFGERVDEMRRRGDLTHRRELARAALELDDDPTAALQLALDNWQVQREPADALLVLQAAVATSRNDAAAEVIAFLQSNRLEDVRMVALIEQLK